MLSSHSSGNSSDKSGALFRAMFPDSDIAQSFRCGKTKVGYLTTYGLAPAIKKEIMRAIKDVEFFCALF